MLRRLRWLGLRETAVGLTPFVRFFSATFLRLLETYGFLYRNRKNVIYSRNVMQNPLRGLCITWRGLRPSYAASAARTSHNSGFTPCRSAGRKRPSARHVVKPAPRYTPFAQVVYKKSYKKDT